MSLSLHEENVFTVGDRETALLNSGRRRPQEICPSVTPSVAIASPPRPSLPAESGGGGWTPRSKSNHASQFFQSAKKLYKHREASPFLNLSKHLPRMFYNAQFSFLFYFFIFKQYHKRVRRVSKKKRRYKELVSPGKFFLCQPQNSHQGCVRSLLEQHQMLKCLH